MIIISVHLSNRKRKALSSNNNTQNGSSSQKVVSSHAKTVDIVSLSALILASLVTLNTDHGGGGDLSESISV